MPSPISAVMSSARNLCIPLLLHNIAITSMQGVNVGAILSLPYAAAE